MEIKKGNILSRTSYMEVLNTNSISTQVSNGRDKWSIDNHILTGECKSATWYNEEKFLSRSSICEILENTNGAVFSVTFNKQVTEESMSSLLDQLINKEINTEQFLSQITLGEGRTLIGYLVDTKQEFGRYKVVDLELQFKGESHNLRQVDSKTITELIFNGVKYKIKGK